MYNNRVYFLYFSGDFTLDIHPVDLDDDARFQCQIGAADGIKPIRSQYATLTVLVPPEPPKLMPTGDLMKTVEGRQVELRCESRGGKPASEVRFTFFPGQMIILCFFVVTGVDSTKCLVVGYSRN